MKASSTSQRLRQIMNLRDLRQVDILRAAEPYCKQFGVKLNKNDLSQYVSGKTVPGQDKLTILGLTLGVSEAWLMGYDVDMDRSPVSASHKALSSNIDNILPMPAMRKIPLVGSIACGTPILAQENREGDVDIPAHIHADFALRCKGDSMINARIYDGDIVYIRQQDTVEHGQIAAVLINDEATLKRVHLFPDHVVLEAENPQYRPRTFWGEEMNSLRILGKAVAFTSDVR